MVRSIGLHLRLQHSLREAAERAIQLELPVFQCFFIQQQTKKLITVDHELVKQFHTWRADHFQSVFIHGSYYINLASLKYDASPLLIRELALAKRLACTHMILHPGSAAGGVNKYDGVPVLARALNKIMRIEKEITLVLENTAHGNKSIGSDITDFRFILEKLDYPERIKFCIDTAHAYSYGYNIKDPIKCNEFIQLVDDVIGIENIAVIHLNDTKQSCGSCIDQHALIGEGIIGEEALKRFVLDPRLINIPLILELPVLPPLQEDAMLQKVHVWHK